MMITTSTINMTTVWVYLFFGQLLVSVIAFPTSGSTSGLLIHR